MSERQPISHLLINSARIERIITRIAYQIFEDTRGSDQLVIFGIDDRGYRLAMLLAGQLTDIYHTTITAHPLGVKEDDGESGQEKPHSGDLEHLPSVRDKNVVIIDDVMYSGRTMYRAIQSVTSQEEPGEIKIAALIDRGHRRYPFNVQYLGLYCPTKLKEHVLCRFLDNGRPEGVWVLSSHNASV